MAGWGMFDDPQPGRVGTDERVEVELFGHERGQRPLRRTCLHPRVAGLPVL